VPPLSAHPSPRPATRRSVTLLESGRSLSGSRALQTALGMVLYGSVVTSIVAVGARQVAEAIADAERSAEYLAPEPKPVGQATEERLQYVGMTAGAVPSPATESALDGDAGAAVTVPGMEENTEARELVEEEVYDEFVLSEIDVDSAVVPDPSSGGPEYPAGLLELRVEGIVLAKFVVDSFGRVTPGSFVSLESTHPAFTRAVDEAMARMKFRPAYVGDKRVPQLVVQSFAFKIAKPTLDTTSRRPVGSPG
jgi:TonB family protein